MGAKRSLRLFLTVVLIVLALCFLGWFLRLIFEGEKPLIEVSPLPEYISGKQTFTLSARDMKRGLRSIEVFVRQEGKKTSVFEEIFPFKGFLNYEGVHSFDAEFFIDPSAIKLTQGRIDLEIYVRDHSRKNGGDGNFSVVEHTMVVDTIPPAIAPVSRMHNINLGGAGLIIYRTSSDTVESGVMVNSHFFRGFQAQGAIQQGLYLCYFAIPHDTKANPEVHLTAKDKAGHESKSGFYCHIRRKRFRSDRINISGRFLKRVLPYFSSEIQDSGTSDIDKFLWINRQLRKENTSTLYDLRSQSVPDRLWEDTWLRLRNAASMAAFGDHRSYFFEGKKVDQQVHLGVDLASLAGSEVKAANSGRVILAERVGIYGLTVVLDHGQGLASSYSHLSRIDVSIGQELMRGDILGLTGQTGLAGGDHLHFGVMVGGIPVNPVEWWDAHWIRDNITKKLALLTK
ncbi:MAG: M23 family metallopeptidase [Thermodesulfobacteriota bacterium]|nr:M23 family metallopeptidase [Thermodesulfobacteriota bacterium]